ncbi:uncharacterized protein STEHIDRAFT_165655 [Stereum hirsutum FP-91666 SS1]|uniref:uncharacterized protein n=1 Tax=Stereum hirsutum (strain FP-91666) TaxID=721885 RepID=UPI0004410205|nr:uncharacterized protein STEHIDRAFT_165655 [Stereum hirsutum FP-91666 SS1]EIM91318.1 hypothetical protein STEHIDRAFT_165655 [Stereum hirsutum FP-91666 SS1]
MPGRDDDWLVADSEDEETLALPERSVNATVAQQPAPSPSTSRPKPSTSAVTASAHAPHGANTEAITHIREHTSAAASTSSPSSSSTKASRPRPKSAYKGATAQQHIDSNAPTSDSIPIETPPPEAAPEPVVVNGHRSGPSTLSQEMGIGLAGMAIDYSQGVLEGMGLGQEAIDYSQGVAERAKTRARKASKKAAAPSPPQDPDVIELTSSEDEIAIVPRKRSLSPPPVPKGKSKPKPRPVKRAKVAHAEVAHTDPHAADTSTESGRLTIPVLSSSLHLPPSDPIPPSSQPHATSPLRGEIRSDSPVPGRKKSSSSRQKKRKRAAVESDDEDDLFPEKPPVSMDVDISRDMLPPPVPEGAASSSSAAFPDSNLTSEASTADGKKAKAAPKRGRKKASDATTEAGNEPVKEKAKPKPRKKGKKAAVEVLIDSPAKPGSKSRAKAGPSVAMDIDRDQPQPPQPDVQDDSMTLDHLPPPKGTETLHDSPSLSPVPDNFDEVPAAKSKKGRAAESRKGKGKAVDVDDDEEEFTVTLKKKSGRGRARAVVSDAEEDEVIRPSKKAATATKKDKGKGKSKENQPDEERGTKSSSQQSKDETPLRAMENVPHSPSPVVVEDEPVQAPSSPATDKPTKPTTPSTPVPAQPSSSAASHASMSRRYTIGRQSKSTPMSEIIRRASSQPSSPFAKAKPYHSPLAKTSKSALKNIVPLHSTRPNPPPPPPRLPPPKKSKKELQREEAWELELADEVKGWEDLSEAQRKVHMRRKREAWLAADE